MTEGVIAKRECGMNVLILTKRFPPLEYRAISQVAYDQALALLEKGVRVTVITQSDSDHDAIENNQGIWIHRVATPNYKASSWEIEPLVWGPNYLHYICTRISLTQFDVIHAHGIDFALALQSLAEFFPIPILAQFHVCFRARADIGEAHFHLELAHYYQYYIAQRSAKVIAVSQADKRHLGHFLNCPDKVIVVPNGLNSERYRHAHEGRYNARGRYKLNDQFVVLWGGRVGDFMKGPDIVGRALAILTKGKTKAILLVAVVQNEPRDSLAQLFANLSEEARNRTLVLFPSDKEELLQLYAAADVFVMPSRYEPFGLMALEAMACGTPVIVSPKDGLDELIDDGQTGLKIQWGSVDEAAESLASKVQLLMDNREYGRFLAGNATAALCRFDLGVVADKLLQVYQDVG